MLRCIVTFYRQAKIAIDKASEDHKVTLNAIKLHCDEVLKRTIASKMDILPSVSKEDMKAFFKKLADDIEERFTTLTD